MEKDIQQFMNEDPIQVEKNIQEFKKRRKNQLMAWIPFVAVILGAAWQGHHPKQIPSGFLGRNFGVIFLLYIVALVVFSFRNWRCPACNGYLGRGINPRSCPSCGVQLR
jgi:hypothetical protein